MLGVHYADGAAWISCIDDLMGMTGPDFEKQKTRTVYVFQAGDELPNHTVFNKDQPMITYVGCYVDPDFNETFHVYLGVELDTEEKEESDGS